MHKTNKQTCCNLCLPVVRVNLFFTLISNVGRPLKNTSLHIVWSSGMSLFPCQIAPVFFFCVWMQTKWSLKAKIKCNKAIWNCDVPSHSLMDTPMPLVVLIVVIFLSIRKVIELNLFCYCTQTSFLLGMHSVHLRVCMQPAYLECLYSVLNVRSILHDQSERVCTSAFILCACAYVVVLPSSILMQV